MVFTCLAEPSKHGPGRRPSFLRAPGHVGHRLPSCNVRTVLHRITRLRKRPLHALLLHLRVLMVILACNFEAPSRFYMCP